MTTAFPLSRLCELGKKVVAENYSDAVIAYIAGSLVEGYGNETSDLDIYAIYDYSRATPPRLPANGFYTIDTSFDGDLRTDTETWSLDHLTSLAERLAEVGPLDWRAAQGFEQRDLDLLHRFRMGTPVLGEDRFAQLRARFDWRRFATVLCVKALLAGTGAAEDAIGAIDAGQPLYAMFSSRQALGYAVDALIAAHGQTNPKAKWREVKLAALNDKAVTDAYLAAELEPSGDPADIMETAKARLRVANGFAAEAAVRAMEH